MRVDVFRDDALTAAEFLELANCVWPRAYDGAQPGNEPFFEK